MAGLKTAFGGKCSIGLLSSVDTAFNLGVSFRIELFGNFLRRLLAHSSERIIDGHREHVYQN